MRFTLRIKPISGKTCADEFRINKTFFFSLCDDERLRNSLRILCLLLVVVVVVVVVVVRSRPHIAGTMTPTKKRIHHVL